VFRAVGGTLELIEIAPASTWSGHLPLMAFRPRIAANLKRMDARISKPGRWGYCPTSTQCRHRAERIAGDGPERAENAADPDRGTALVTAQVAASGRDCAGSAGRWLQGRHGQHRETSAAAETLKTAALAYRFDVADIASHAALLDRVDRELGPITCLVNNAGSPRWCAATCWSCHLRASTVVWPSTCAARSS
jgi:hypothetical protein